MLGLWGVGKTSLVSRYISQVFDEKYHATLGVKMDTKEVELSNHKVKMVLWDIAGSENNFSTPMHFIAGAAACILVLDGTRKESFDHGLELIELVKQNIGDIPYIIAVNKKDLSWAIQDSEIDSFIDSHCADSFGWCATSAKTGENVERIFLKLAEEIG